jgi:Reverse transcriptase (RNA-dependent DNA polymerase)/Endonuclease-reverse transcriptase
LSCVFFNARSLCNKSGELKALLQSLIYDVVLVCETWLTERETDRSLVAFSDYKIFRRDRRSKGGGVCIFVRKNLSCVQVVLPPSFDSVEVVSIVMGKARFACLYRAPNDETDPLVFDALIDFLSQASPLCLTGDFNLPGIDWNRLVSSPDPVSQVIFDTCCRNALTQYITEPTRGTKTLDLLFCNEPHFLVQGSVCPPFSTSDHNSLQFTALSLSNLKSRPKQYRDFKRASYDLISVFLSEVRWDEVFSNCISVQEFWSSFQQILNQAIEHFVPLRELRHPKARHSRSHRRLLNKKRALWKRLRKDPGNTTLRTVYNQCSRECKQLATDNYQKQVNQIISKKDPRAFYSFLNKNLKSNTCISALVDSDGATLHSSVEKAELLNNTFSAVFTVDDGSHHLCPPRIPQEDFLTEVCFSESIVSDYLRRLKPKGSSGPDGIPSIFLKRLKFYLSYPLSKIFQVSFLSGCLPEDWLVSKVTPIFKKGVASNPSNYRPVSLTSTCCRLMESIIKDTITSHFKRHDLITAHQHGFRKGRSTETQLLECVNDWTLALDQGFCVDIVYIDFAKAFDSVSHNKLLCKILGYGISGKLNAWISAFLQNRSQYVAIEDECSSVSPVLSGVPQGSVLGPVLFEVYINDLPDCLPKEITTKLFADDVKLYKVIRNLSDQALLQGALDSLANWSLIWQLPVSASKCDLIQLGHKPLVSSYTLNGVNIQPSKCVRDLGVLIDSSLGFHQHIASITAKAYKLLGIIFRCLPNSEPVLLVRAFKTYVRPILEYGSIIWSPNHSQAILTLEKVQRYFSRRALGFPSLSYIERLIVLGLEFLEKRRLVSDLGFCHRLLNGEYDIDFSQFMQTPAMLSLRSSSRLSNNQKLAVPHARLNIRKHCFPVRVIPIWNSLSDKIVNVRNSRDFMRVLYKIDI